jgi:hypothetical protein
VKARHVGPVEPVRVWLIFARRHDGWMVGWLDGWVVGWLGGWVVGWLGG